jgi:hypothetical protein
MKDAGILCCYSFDRFWENKIGFATQRKKENINGSKDITWVEAKLSVKLMHYSLTILTPPPIPSH